MNKELLEKLQFQAAAQVNPLLRDREWQRVYNEKFAELIVKECAAVQHKRFCEHGDVSWDILMEHFGVEK